MVALSHRTNGFARRVPVPTKPRNIISPTLGPSSHGLPPQQMTAMFHLPASRLLSRNALRSLSISSPPLSSSLHASVLRSSFFSRAAATEQTTALRSLARQTQPAPTTSLFFLLLRPQQHVQVRALRTSREPSLPTTHKTPLPPAAKSLRERVWAEGQLSDLQEPPAMSTVTSLRPRSPPPPGPPTADP